MKTLIALTALALVTYAHASNISPVKGSCHVTVPGNGAHDISLTQVDPNQTDGRALEGTTDGFEIFVQLRTGDFSQFGSDPHDFTFLRIHSASKRSEHVLSGRALVGGKPLLGDLEDGGKSIQCRVLYDK